ncbi:LytR/AlgR family response regulator transcription factor [Mycolicibacterium confluentis]|uniref:DNA-binding response regulator n=1 Tax=Mycolicibacterium confluentis TaxID=28047 RepID=A0A7I7XSN6_9MYCO|nr:LytTR family DNA-binding domain-containing protein [Mycolicibacterium confluentis]MCV7321282.1 response regulator transcription factor [Mycolicibacterium confluentis]ORV25242.1 LytR family transcriptional regulator [Mycolicibacterium confluentis]BBZ32238.1 DNA-binding response regulator [Mycolicibacterium confluentis]
MTSPLTVLAVDDEAPALDELIYLLTNNESVGEVHGVSDANAALRELSEHSIDAIFLDINMPGLSGLELAAVLGNFSNPPAVVFVTAHEDKAVAAFDVGAIDYLLKPLRRERLDEAVRRVVAARTAEPQTGGDDEVVPVELAGITSLVRRDTIGWVEADGDYARLHSSSGSHLVRIPLSTLETRWRNSGFQRVHRSYLVALGMVTGLRNTDSGVLVRIRENGASPAVELPVSRRQTRELRDRLVREPMRSYRPVEP